MKKYCCGLTGLLVIASLALTGCSKPNPPAGSEKKTADAQESLEIQVGDSCDSVRKKLGKPNIESKTQSSLVLIYDQMEIKLTNAVVSQVYDHRN